jgi:AhpD family alkylhydroperoxidase
MHLANTLETLIAGGKLNPAEQGRVRQTASQFNGCEQCAAAHTMESKMQGISEDEMMKIRHGDTSAPQRAAFMCAYSRMIVKHDGRCGVYACTLVDDDAQFDMGETLRQSFNVRIRLKHHRCYSCFAYGSCCPPAMCRKAYKHQYLTSIRRLAMFTRQLFCLTAILLAAASAAVYIAREAEPDAGSHEPASRLAVVWSSGDLDVAHRVCLMYAHGAPGISRRPYRARLKRLASEEEP